METEISPTATALEKLYNVDRRIIGEWAKKMNPKLMTLLTKGLHLKFIVKLKVGGRSLKTNFLIGLSKNELFLKPIYFKYLFFKYFLSQSLFFFNLFTVKQYSILSVLKASSFGL